MSVLEAQQLAGARLAAVKRHPLAVIPPETSSQSDLHRNLIAGLIARGAWTAQWRHQVIACIARTLGSSYGPDGSDELYVPGLRPDAYRIDTWDDDGYPQIKITVWEVEISNPISPPKLRQYANLWGDLDGIDTTPELELRTVDRHGVERLIDLSAEFDAPTVA